MNPEDLLTNALHDRVERTDYPSTPLSAVAGRAGALRARRRRTTALAAAAAVAVVVLPATLWFGRSPDASPRPGQTLSSGPTQPTPDTSAPLSLDGLSLGEKPGIAYLVGDTYVPMNGDRITDPVLRNAKMATPVRAGLLVATPGRLPQVSQLVLHTDQGNQQLGCGSPRFAMSTDGTESAYWVSDACTGKFTGRLYTDANNTMGESGPASVKTYSTGVVEPVGIVRQGTIVNGLLGSARPQVVDAAGNTSLIANLATAAGSDENNDVVSGQLSADTSTGAVIKVVDGSVVCRAPGWQVGQFSTDGKYVLGAQPADGFPDGYAVFDASTCQMVIRLRVPGTNALSGPSIRQFAWDVDDTVLAVASNTDSSAIVRFDLQGHLTRATPVADTQNAYRLATRP